MSRSDVASDMADAFQYDVFLSHSSKDKAVVRPLAERLRNDGLKVWFDEWVLKAGDSIPSKIEEGLEHSRVLVLRAPGEDASVLNRSLAAAGLNPSGVVGSGQVEMLDSARWRAESGGRAVAKGRTEGVV